MAMDTPDPAPTPAPEARVISRGEGLATALRGIAAAFTRAAEHAAYLAEEAEHGPGEV